jgi:hypothetical protein
LIGKLGLNGGRRSLGTRPGGEIHSFRHLLAVLGALVLVASTSGYAAAAVEKSHSLQATACSGGYVTASLSWGTKCLRTGEFCKVGNPEYHRYGFDCPPSGFLAHYHGASSGGATATPPSAESSAVGVGRTVLFAGRSRTSGCLGGPTPDRHCSPGAYYSLLTRAVICSPGFHTGTIRDVPQSEKFQVEQEYGMAPSYYGYTLEIDHIVPLELGGSNDIANLFPEPGSGKANYHLKDELENKLHDLVCSGAISLRTAQRGIATNWQSIYERIFGATPSG